MLFLPFMPLKKTQEKIRFEILNKFVRSGTLDMWSKIPETVTNINIASMHAL